MLILILLGVVALVLAIIVLVTAKEWNLRLLAALGLVGGLAIVINSLPSDGGDK